MENRSLCRQHSLGTLHRDRKSPVPFPEIQPARDGADIKSIETHSLQFLKKLFGNKLRYLKKPLKLSGLGPII
jgi:hypothetical protein